MENKLVLNEKYSSWWVQITAGFALTAVMLFFIYSSTDVVVWKGVIRLASFCFLAAAVFSGLKVMEGKHTIVLEIKDGHLVITYYKRDREIAEDLFKLEEISTLHIVRKPSYLFSTDYIFNDRLIRMAQKDSDRALTLIEIDGRNLALSKETAEEAVKFITGHAPGAEIPDIAGGEGP